jgi:uncharacterized protein (TIGR02117 family)
VIRLFIRYSLFTLFGILSFVIVYIVGAFLISKIPVNSELNTARGNHKVQIYLLSNGVHTDIVLPVKNPIVRWDTVFPIENTRGKFDDAKNIAIGWGDKGFYLNTPTWGDLTFSTAFKAVSGLSTTALHTTYYKELKKGDNCVMFKVSTHDYRLLKSYILKSLKYNKKNKPIYIKTNAVYGDRDAFYDAVGAYHLFSTCNTWTNDALKYSNQKASLWTPFQSGIFEHYK